MAEIVVRTDSVTQPRFAGVGFHVSFHQHGAGPDRMQMLWQRWRELNPSFARVGYLLKHGQAGLEALADLLLGMKETGTSVYLVTWDPDDLQPGPDIDAYGRRIADHLEYLVRERGATNVRWYCMCNELSMHRWADMLDDLPRFRAYHQAIHDEIAARGLPVGLLASDASPIKYWNTVEWAAEHMDDITEIYGGHHYFNEHGPDDAAFYAWFVEHLRRGVAIGRRMGKDFILGEFGSAQDGRVIDGRKMDVCVHFGAQTESLVGIQLAEGAIAALNAGILALGNWTFTDYPDSYMANYVNRWGTFEWEGERRTRAHYYGYGLMTRFFRGPATAFAVESDDPLVRAGAVRHHDGDTWSIAVVNRGESEAPLAVQADGVDATFRKYVYDPNAVPWNDEARLQPLAAEVQMTGGRLCDSAAAGTLSVYTTA